MEVSGPSGLNKTAGSMGELSDRQGTPGFGGSNGAEVIGQNNTFNTENSQERQNSGKTLSDNRY